MKRFEGSPVLARAVARIVPVNAEIEDAMCELLLTKHGFIVITEAWDEEAWKVSGYKKILEIRRGKLRTIEKYRDKSYNPESEYSYDAAGAHDVLEIRYCNDENKMGKVYFSDLGDGINNLIRTFKKEFCAPTWLTKHWGS